MTDHLNLALLIFWTKTFYTSPLNYLHKILPSPIFPKPGISFIRHCTFYMIMKISYSFSLNGAFQLPYLDAMVDMYPYLHHNIFYFTLCESHVLPRFVSGSLTFQLFILSIFQIKLDYLQTVSSIAPSFEYTQ